MGRLEDWVVSLYYYALVCIGLKAGFRIIYVSPYIVPIFMMELQEIITLLIHLHGIGNRLP